MLFGDAAIPLITMVSILPIGDLAIRYSRVTRVLAKLRATFDSFALWGKAATVVAAIPRGWGAVAPIP